jgi:hypothetical protein
VKANRAIVFATTISGSGASTELTFAGYYKNLRDDLLAWDAANGNRFGFAAGAADGQIPKEVNGYNIEGAEFGAGGSSTLYLGFRAPIVPTSNRTQALVVPVTNLTGLMSLNGTSGGPATFGSPLQWNLTPAGYVNPLGHTSALGIREIRKNAHDQYLVVAGSYEEVPAAPTGGAEFVYVWDGNPADQPLLTNTVLPTPDAGSVESIVSVPDPLVNGAPVTFLYDNGDNDYYNTSQEAKDLDPGLQKDRADVFDLAFPPPTITASATSNGQPYTGGTWTNHDVIVHFDCTDNSGTGVASVTPDQTVSSEGAGQSVTGTCTDNAGDSAQATFSNIQIDKTPPTVSITTPASGAFYTQGQVVNAAFSCGDALSGPASCVGTVASGSPIDTSNGPHSFTVTAQDQAGNQASQTVQYTAAQQLSGNQTSCTGWFMGTGKDVVVPAGAVCHLAPGTNVTHDLTVQKGGTLDARGVTAGHDLSSDGAAGVTVCSTNIAHDLTVQNSTGAVLIGDTSGGCASGNTVGHDLTVQNTTGAVDVGDNTVTHDVKVQNNTPGGAKINRNNAGHDATCQGNSPQSGAGNTAAHSNTCPS